MAIASVKLVQQCCEAESRMPMLEMGKLRQIGEVSDPGSSRQGVAEPSLRTRSPGSLPRTQQPSADGTQRAGPLRSLQAGVIYTGPQTPVSATAPPHVICAVIKNQFSGGRGASAPTMCHLLLSLIYYPPSLGTREWKHQQNRCPASR